MSSYLKNQNPDPALPQDMDVFVPYAALKTCPVMTIRSAAITSCVSSPDVLQMCKMMLHICIIHFRI